MGIAVALISYLETTVNVDCESGLVGYLSSVIHDSSHPPLACVLLVRGFILISG